MENIKQVNFEPGTIPLSAFVIEKVHRCEDCPMRKLAIRQPKSLLARLHFWHMTWWPGWKAYQVRACAFNAKARA